MIFKMLLILVTLQREQEKFLEVYDSIMDLMDLMDLIGIIGIIE